MFFTYISYIYEYTVNSMLYVYMNDIYSYRWKGLDSRLLFFNYATSEHFFEQKIDLNWNILNLFIQAIWICSYKQNFGFCTGVFFKRIRTNRMSKNLTTTNKCAYQVASFSEDQYEYISFIFSAFHSSFRCHRWIRWSPNFILTFFSLLLLLFGLVNGWSKYVYMFMLSGSDQNMRYTQMEFM